MDTGTSRKAGFVKPVEVVVSVRDSGKRKPLLCRLNLHHKWVHGVDSDGQHYLRCPACGKDRRYDLERQEPDRGGGMVAGSDMSPGG